MKKIVLENLGEENLNATFSQYFEVGACGLQGVNIGDRGGVNTLHYQHIFVGVGPVDFGDIEQG